MQRYINKNNILYLITGIIIFFIIAFLSQNCCFWEDDEHYSIVQNMDRLFDCMHFKTEHGAGYIGFLFAKFFSYYLPIKLNIHPGDFLGSPALAFIKTLFIIPVLLVLLKFINLFHKSSLNYLFFVFLFIYFIFSVFYTNSYILVLNYQFFRYFFSILFFGYFIYFAFKHLLGENITPPPKPSPGGRAGWGDCQTCNLILAMIAGYITGTSSEILIYATAAIYVFTVFYNILAKFSKLKPFNMGKFYHILFIPYFIGAYLFMSSPGYLDVAFGLRGLNHINISFEEIVIYTKIYFAVLFRYLALYWIICAALIFGLFKIKADKQKMILPFVFQLIILGLYYSLIVCGEAPHSPTELIVDGYRSIYFITHKQLRFLFQMVMLIPLFMYYSLFISCFISQQKSNSRKSPTQPLPLEGGGQGGGDPELIAGMVDETKKKLSELITSVFLVIISFCFIISINVMWEDYIGNKYMAQLKRDNYILEKTYRFQVLNRHEPLTLNFTINNRPTHWFSNYADIIFYYRGIYKPEGDYPSRFNIGYDGISYFYSNGGVFSEEELDNIKFSRLFDEDFVLYNKESGQK